MSRIRGNGQVNPLSTEEYKVWQELETKRKEGKDLDIRETLLLAQLEEDAKKLEAQKRKEILEARRHNLAGKSTSRPWSRMFEKKVRILSIEQNCSHFRVTDVPWKYDGIIIDKFWGKAAEIGPDIIPAEITIGNDTRTGFVIDGDKGCGVTVRRSAEPTIQVTGADGNVTKTSLMDLTGTAGLMFSIVDSKKLGDAYGTDATTRTKMMYFVVGGLVFLLLFGGMI
ncbi:MAG: hypothetical protein WC683_04810 [bacterium]